MVLLIRTYEYLEKGGTTGHNTLIEDAKNDRNVVFTEEEMEIIKRGCEFPDTSGSGLNDMKLYPFHGYVYHEVENTTYKRYSNYVANYILLTEVAFYNGNIQNALASGVVEEDKLLFMYAFAPNGNLDAINQSEGPNGYGTHFSTFNVNHVGNKTYAQAFDEMGLDTAKAGVAYYRRLFLYGMAMHYASDIYAHSTWVWKDDFYRRNGHPNCDSENYFPKRYEAAEQVMKNVIVRAKNNSIGLPQDLLVSTGLYGSASSDRYYLYRLLPYIREVDEALYNNWNRYQSSYYTSTIYGDLLSNVSENQCKDVYLDNH